MGVDVTFTPRSVNLTETKTAYGASRSMVSDASRPCLRISLVGIDRDLRFRTFDHNRQFIRRQLFRNLRSVCGWIYCKPRPANLHHWRLSMYHCPVRPL
jgi:hypothetical protein